MKKIKFILLVLVSVFLLSSCKAHHPGCLSIKSATELVVNMLKK